MSDDHPQPEARHHPHPADDFGATRNPAEASGSSPQPSESPGDAPKSSAEHGNAPRNTETDRTQPQNADDRSHPPQGSEGDGGAPNTHSHVLTVREVMLQLDRAGVPRSERTVCEWCRPNRHGESRLDAYYDQNERRYRITEESARQVIAEELLKAGTERHSLSSEPVKPSSRGTESTSTDTPEVARLQDELLNLKIDNKAKETVINQLVSERKELVDAVAGANHRIGSLETELRLLGTGEAGEGKPVDNAA